MIRYTLTDAQWAKIEPLCSGKAADPGRSAADNRLFKADRFRKIFAALSDSPDMEYAMIDSTIVKVYRHGQGAKGGPEIKPLANPKAE